MIKVDDRYNRPLTRALELYVLWSIGELPDNHEQLLESVTSKLRKAHGLGGNWQEVIASVMGFPPDLPSGIRDMWLQNQEIARVHGDTLTPQRFAEMVVDNNF